VASLPYNERLQTKDFASSELVDEDKWMKRVLFSLDEKWENRLLVWMSRPETEPRGFVELARMYVPSVLALTEFIYTRELTDI